MVRSAVTRAVAAAGTRLFTRTLVGVAVGDFVHVSADYDLQGLSVTGYCHASGSVTVVMNNNTAGVIDLASGNWNFMITRNNPA